MAPAPAPVPVPGRVMRVCEGGREREVREN